MMTATLLSLFLSASDAGSLSDEPLLQWVRGTEAPSEQRMFHDPSEYFRYQRAHCSRVVLGEAFARAVAADAMRLLQGDGPVEVKERAARLLGWMQRPEAISALAAAAASSEAKVSAAAINALSFFGETRAWETTIGGGGRPISVTFDRRPDARATEALINLAGRKNLKAEAITALIAAASHHRSAKLIGLITALPNVHETERDGLLGLYRSLPSPESTRGLARLLRSPWQYWPYAAEAAARTHDPQVVAPLLVQLGSPSKPIRRAAYEALSQLSDAKVSAEEPLEDVALMRKKFIQKLGANGEKLLRRPQALVVADEEEEDEEPSSCAEEE